MKRKAPDVTFGSITHDFDISRAVASRKTAQFVRQFERYAKQANITVDEIEQLTQRIRSGHRSMKRLHPLAKIICKYGQHLNLPWCPFTHLFSDIVNVCDSTFVVSDVYATRLFTQLFKLASTEYPFSLRTDFFFATSPQTDSIYESLLRIGQWLRAVPSIHALANALMPRVENVLNSIAGGWCAAPDVCHADFKNANHILLTWEAADYTIRSNESSGFKLEDLCSLFGHLYQHGCWPSLEWKSIFQRFLARLHCTVYVRDNCDVFHRNYRLSAYSLLLPILINRNVRFCFPAVTTSCGEKRNAAFQLKLKELLQSNKYRLKACRRFILRRIITHIMFPNANLYPFTNGHVFQMIYSFAFNKTVTEWRQLAFTEEKVTSRST